MPRTPSLALLYVTMPTRQSAEKLSAALLKERLIACANVLGPVTALYRWKGKTARGREFALLLKTERRKLGALRKEIVKHHPYECPCILTIRVDHAHPPFLSWVAESVA